MALWEFINLNKHGNFRTRIIHTEGALNLPGDGLGKMVFVKRFKYEYKHPFMAPTLLKKDNKTYLMPYWREVENGTTLNDIEWIKPIVKKTEIIEHKFKSSSNDKFYITKEFIEIDGKHKFSCNCPGVWRAKDRRCKHIKSLE